MSLHSAFIRCKCSGIVVIGVLLTACDGDVLEPADATKLTFVVHPTNVMSTEPIAPAVVVALQDASGNTVAGAAHEVTMTLGANTTGATLSGTVTVAAINGVATFSDLRVDRPGSGYTLQATAGELKSTASAPFAVALAIIDVDGTLRDMAGDPIAGADVHVIGMEPVISGADGRFSVASVRAPYDVAFIVRHETKDLSWAIVYQGLTRSDPTLFYPYVRGPPKAATISGVTPQTSGPDVLTRLIFASDYGGFGTSADGATGQYQMTIPWQASTNTVSGNLHLLRLTVDSLGLPAQYDGYAVKPLAISAGGTYPGNDFATPELTDPPEHAISGAVQVPGGYELWSRAVGVTFGDRPLVIAEEGNPQSSFSYTVPDVGGAGYAVRAVALAEGLTGGTIGSVFVKNGIGGASANVTLPLEPAPQPTNPSKRATDVDISTPLEWVQGGGMGVNVLWLTPNFSSHPIFIVFTTGSEVIIPDLAAHGMEMPAGAQYWWYVERLFPLASVDQAADESFLAFNSGRAGDLGWTWSEDFSFTTRLTAGAGLRAPSQLSSSPATELPRHGFGRGLGWLDLPGEVGPPGAWRR